MSNKLFADFPATDKATWLTKVEKDLKGKALSELDWQLEEHIRLAPFYTAEDTNERAAFQAANAWQIGEDIVVKDAVAANKQLLQALEQGVDAPRLILEQSCDWTSLLKGVHTEMIALHIQDKANNRAAFQDYAKGGKLVAAYHQAEATISNQLKLHQALPQVRTLIITQDETTQTSTAIANLIRRATDVLEQALASGISGKAANEAMLFQVCIGKQYFVAIAMLRAIKLLWANVLKAYQVEDTTLPPLDVYIAPSAYDEATYTNMVRASTIGLSAVVGGASRLTILPANAAHEQANAFTSRIARNVQHLLKMESYLDRVGDPAAGSYYIERLTDALAEEAWKQFQEK